MKTVIVTKDEYVDKTVRVNFFEEGVKVKNKVCQFNEKTKKIETVYISNTENKLLHCVRLEWSNNESELNEDIKLIKDKLELQINNI